VSDRIASPGLTVDERAVLSSLVSAWETWRKLDDKHPDDDAEFRHSLHALQMLIAYRVARRVDPDDWWSGSSGKAPSEGDEAVTRKATTLKDIAERGRLSPPEIDRLMGKGS
jgi:hypothetical protein